MRSSICVKPVGAVLAQLHQTRTARDAVRSRCDVACRYNEALVDDLLRVVLALSAKRTVVVIANELRSVRGAVASNREAAVPLGQQECKQRLACMYRRSRRPVIRLGFKEAGAVFLGSILVW